MSTGCKRIRISLGGASARNLPVAGDDDEEEDDSSSSEGESVSSEEADDSEEELDDDDDVEDDEEEGIGGSEGQSEEDESGEEGGVDDDESSGDDGDEGQEADETSEDEEEGENLYDALARYFGSQPRDKWVAAAAPPDTSSSPSGAVAFEGGASSTHDTLEGGAFVNLPDDILLHVAEHLDPHEMHHFFASCERCRRLGDASTSTNVHAIRLTSVLRYFCILKCHADWVRSSVDGGWATMVPFLTRVACRMQETYGEFRVNRLHRVLVAEQVIELACGLGGPLWSRPCNGRQPTPTGTGDGDASPRRRPSFSRCFVSRPGEHTVFLGDVVHSPFDAGTGDVNDYLKAWLDHAKHVESSNGIDEHSADRINKGLLPVVWLFENSQAEPVSYSLGGGDDDDQVLYSWSTYGVSPADVPSDGASERSSVIRCPWIRETFRHSELCASHPIPQGSIMAFFCLGLGYEFMDYDEYGAASALRRFAWLRAHGLVSLTDVAVNDGRDLVGLNHTCQYWKEQVDLLEHDVGVNRETGEFARAALSGNVPLAIPSDYLADD